ncbi:ankyrin repeat domain-containing protein [Actinomadura sp. 21ATH]|uniref:ankyrin repeat domain-containing protein n=1 Tax=Actinomadura sp. 21ATH TaxID=1735444 RepID=UPI0035C06782
MTVVPDGVPPDLFSAGELRLLGEAGIALFAGRLVLDAQPPIDDAALAAVAERCAGPLPEALVALWRITFGGRLDYDLRGDIGGQDVAVSFSELFHPGSDGYHDLWGWIDHECALAEEHRSGWSGRLAHLPIGGFEYLERVYVDTATGPDHGAVDCWRQGLPPGWELQTGDRVGRLADDLRALFGRLVLEHDPWTLEDDAVEAGTDLRDAVDELAGRADPHARTAAEKLRRLVRATVLDWRGALEQGTLAKRRRLRRLALDRAAAADDVELLARLVELGCDPAEEVGNGMTPIDVALRGGATAAVRWLLDQGVPVENGLLAGAHAVDAGLARDLIDRGATVDACALSQALANQDVEVVRVLSRAVQPDDELARLVPRLRTLAVQAGQDPHRSAVLTELADRFDRNHRT